MANENEQNNAKPTFRTDDKDWEISFKGWKRKDLKAFTNAADRAGAGETDALLPFYGQVILRWPYTPLDPKKPEDYDELLIEDWTEVSQRVVAAFQLKVNPS